MGGVLLNKVICMRFLLFLTIGFVIACAFGAWCLSEIWLIVLALICAAAFILLWKIRPNKFKKIIASMESFEKKNKENEWVEQESKILSNRL